MTLNLWWVLSKNADDFLLQKNDRIDREVTIRTVASGSISCLMICLGKESIVPKSQELWLFNCLSKKAKYYKK